jgi:hypothetical protein
MLFSIEFVIAIPWRPEPEVIDFHNVDCRDIGGAELKAESILKTTYMPRRPDGYRILQDGKIIIDRRHH